MSQVRQTLLLRARAHPPVLTTHAPVGCSAVFGGQVPLVPSRCQIQLITVSPATRRKCLVLVVTSVRPSDCA